MKGISYLTDDVGNRTAVVLDLRKHRRLWEDISDRLRIESRRMEPRDSLEIVRKKLSRHAAKPGRSAMAFARVLVAMAMGCAAVIMGATPRRADAEPMPTTAASTQPTAPDQDLPKITILDVARNQGGMKQMGLLAIKFAKEHHNVMPHDLGQTLASKPDVDAAIYLTVADLNAHLAPSPLTAEWINKNTSYIYLAADASMNKPPPDPNMHWNDVVMAYTKDPFRFGPHSPFMVNLVFMDGRTETDRVDQAKPRIAESINALRSVTDTDKPQK